MDTPAAPWNFSIWGASKLLQNQFTGIVQAISTSIDPEQKIAKLKAELQVQMVQHGSTNYSEATKCSGQVVDLLPVYYVNNTKEETTMKLSKLFVYFLSTPASPPLSGKIKGINVLQRIFVFVWVKNSWKITFKKKTKRTASHHNRPSGLKEQADTPNRSASHKFFGTFKC